MALTADRNTPERDGIQFSYPIAASTECFAGGIAVLDSSGNVEPGTAATGKVACGIFSEYVNNTGAAAAKNIEVKSGTFLFKNSTGDAVTKTSIGDTVYIEDDETVCATGTSKSAAGIMVDIETAGVWVKIEPPVSLVSGLTAANNLSDVGTAVTARGNIGADQNHLSLRATNLVAASAKVYRIVSPWAGTIDKIYSILQGAALAAGNATLTCSIGSTAITTGVITITQVGSAEGDIDSCTPSALNVLAAGDAIEVTVGGANTDTDAFAEVIIQISRDV